MFFGVVCQPHDDLCRRAAMDSVVHFILDSGEEIFCGLTVKRIVHGGCIDVCDFLIEATLTCPNLLNFRNRVVKIIFIENLTVDQPILIQDISLLGKCVQHLGRPLSELRRSPGIDSVADSNNGSERIKLILVGFPIVRSLCKICTNCGRFVTLNVIEKVKALWYN